MRVLVIGDTHGNTPWLTGYIYPLAAALNVQSIIQVGDFGYWEHLPAGVQFLDDVDAAGLETAIPLHWLHGNHDKYSLTLQKYKHRDAEGFIQVRPWVLYIPQGHVWEWEGRLMRAFGGAYSVDKAYRLSLEDKHYRQARQREEFRRGAGVKPQPVLSTKETLWFPEEEMTDLELDALLAANSEPMQYVFSHDKVRGSNPGWNRKDFPECLPNQDRLQRAMLAHTPNYWFHGHLHYAYQQTVRSGPESGTTVIGLDCDDQAAEHGWKPQQAWAVIDLMDDGTDRVLLGGDPELVIDHDEFRRVASVLK